MNMLMWHLTMDTAYAIVKEAFLPISVLLSISKATYMHQSNFSKLIKSVLGTNMTDMYMKVY